jgi:capsule polysaccharide export protein KpsE/RkpR
MLLRVGMYALLVSTLVAFLIPKRYEAWTMLMPPEGVSGAGMAMLNTLSARGTAGTGSGIGGALGGAVLGGVASDLMGTKSNGALFIDMLETRSVSDRIIEQFQLDRVYHTKRIEDTRISLWQRVDISEDRKSGVITLSVIDNDPRRAAGMAQAFVTELDRLVAQVSTSSARRERIFLEERLKSVKTDLDAAAKRFSEFASKNTAIDVPAQGKAMVEAAAMLQGELIFAQSQLRGLQQIYTPSNVRVRALQARVSELQQQLQKLGGSDSPGELKNDNALYPSIRKLPLLGVTYFDLYRESKMQETLYELLTQQFELAKVQEAKEIPSVKVLDPALIPTKKTFPPRLQIMALGTVLSLTVAVLSIFLRRWWNQIDPDDPGRLLLEEMRVSLGASTQRFAPAGVAKRALARVRRVLPEKRLAPEMPQEKEDAEKTTGVIKDRPEDREEGLLRKTAGPNI